MSALILAVAGTVLAVAGIVTGWTRRELAGLAMSAAGCVLGGASGAYGRHLWLTAFCGALLACGVVLIVLEVRASRNAEGNR